jgi:hypothetical protein
MKKSKLFMAMGTLLLAATAIFATKASKKFNGTAVNTAYTHSSVEYFVQKIGSGAGFSMVTTASATHQLQLKINNGTANRLFTKSSGGTDVTD